MGLGTILIRAEASPEIGTGHVMRCLALAQEWRDQGGHAVFAMAESTPSVRERVAAEDCEIADVLAPAGSSEDCEWLVRHARDKRAAWVVLDGYRFGAEYHQALREGPWKVLCIDDDGRCSEYGADLILNQNVTASPEMYENRTRSQSLVGPRYALLRKEFSRWRDWKRTIPRTAKGVLVTLGGSTPMDVAQTVLAALARIRMEDVVVNFVIGGKIPLPESIERTAASPAVTFIRNPANMPELMATADVAVSAAGSTCWELCFFGVPSLLIDLAPNQTLIAESLHRDGYAMHAGAARNLSVEKLAGQWCELLISEEYRRRLSERCRNLVDGRGAWRVVAAMRSEQLTFRRATEEDAKLLWLWANDPSVREASLSSDRISWEEHEVWLRNRLVNPGSLLIVAEEAGEPIGTVRLEKSHDGRAKISLTLAPASRGLGLAAKVIEHGVEQAASILGVTEVEAVVKLWNDPSKKAFENAGFHVVSQFDAAASDLIHYRREASAQDAAPACPVAAGGRA